MQEPRVAVNTDQWRETRKILYRQPGTKMSWPRPGIVRVKTRWDPAIHAFLRRYLPGDSWTVEYSGLNAIYRFRYEKEN